MVTAFTLSVLALTALVPPAFAAPVAPPLGAASPVSINNCGPIIDKNANNAPQTPSIAGIPLASTSTGIQIEFTNESSGTADLVNFAVDSNGNRFVIRDVGTFSPGISIKHMFRNGAGQAFVLPALIAPNVTCSVQSVRFTDGTVWRKGQPVTAASPGSASPNAGNVRLVATPSRVEIDRATDTELFLVTSSQRVTAFKETDDCQNVASVFVAATGQSSATYAVRPIGAGTCTAHLTDESGNVLTVPITIQ